MQEIKLNPDYIKLLETYQEMYGSIPIGVYKSCLEVQKKENLKQLVQDMAKGNSPYYDP